MDAITLVAAVYKALVIKNPGHEDQSVHDPHGEHDQPQGGKLRQMRDVVNTVKKMSVDELRTAMQGESEADKHKFVARVLGEWDDDNGVGKLRNQAAKFLALTTPGQPLAFLHPGPTTLYRGGKEFTGKTPVSFSADKKYAAGYGKLQAPQIITAETPAIDYDKLTGSAMKEIIAFQKSSK